ncbi:transporter substrate-binding domain-containing protein [Haliovirga abyssi]|uniref:Amino acid ABC transporter substrate-binding protein n=1 Tax=Haliovirga abyssi TaxID=2996794 RepID=A0AAU9DRX9_9FUSO|nr:transporter substrate-binding domain-containing protein [Haliovirga abyssi]BDU51358.1 amino acid ABC transporter substrate-binding protein [Haliovirga abyssi]
MKKVLLSLFSLVLVLSFAGCGESKEANNFDSRAKLAKDSVLEKVLKSGTLKVGLEAGYLPFEFMSKDGKLIGFDVDLAKEMGKELGVKVEFVNTAWDGIIPSLQLGKYDIITSGMTRTLQRALSVNFTEPYYETGQVIMVRKGETRFNSYKDLNNPAIKVAVKLGTTSDIVSGKMLKKAKRIPFKTEADAAMALRTKKVDAMVYDKPFISDYVEKFNDVKMMPELFSKEFFGFAIKKGDPDFLNWLNLFIAEIKANGTYEELYNKWFVEKEYKK